VAGSGSSEITVLLKAWRGGDENALERLMPLVYDELRRLARRHMRRERQANTLQTTVLVHEAYLRLAGAKGIDWKDRVHFFALCARIMRQILVDAARVRASVKRGGNVERASDSSGFQLDEIGDRVPQRTVELLALDEALQDLARVDPRKSRVVELRFFGGLSVYETAEVLNISPQSVMRDWKLARAWLMRELGKPTDGQKRPIRRRNPSGSLG
jgi:RNA polymerase sigma factor (TIGR02999 family)